MSIKITDFIDVPQSEPINKLMELDTARDTIVLIDPILGEYGIMHDKTEYRIELPPESVLAFQWSAFEKKVFVAIREIYNLYKTPDMLFPIEFLLERFGLTSKADLRKKLKVSLVWLCAIRYKIAPSSGKWGRICESAEVTCGFVKIKLAPEFVKELRRKGLLQLPRLYYSLSAPYHRHSAAMLYFIASSSFLAKKSATRGDVLSIGSLLAHTPTLPTIEEVKAAPVARVKEKIVDPFFKELHSLDSVLEFRYKTRYGEELQENQVRALPYPAFADVRVCFYWKNSEQIRPYVPKQNENRDAAVDNDSVAQ